VYEAVTTTGTVEVLNVGLTGRAMGEVAELVVEVATVVWADDPAVEDPQATCDVRVALRASGDTPIPEQRRRENRPIESCRSLRRSRSA